jgi:hypothetical protein
MLPLFMVGGHPEAIICGDWLVRVYHDDFAQEINMEHQHAQLLDVYNRTQLYYNTLKDDIANSSPIIPWI